MPNTLPRCCCVVCAGQIVKTKINLVVVTTHIQKKRRHFPSADKYAMLWLGLSCLSTKSHYICFILFAATSSVSVAAAAACASSTSSRMSSLASFAFPSPTLPLYCLLAYSLFAISAFFYRLFQLLGQSTFVSLYIQHIPI